MLCLPLLSSSNSTEQLSKASAWNDSLFAAPYRILHQLLLWKKTAGPFFPWHQWERWNVHLDHCMQCHQQQWRALSSTKEWYQADATELPNFPKFLQLLGPNKWCDKPIPVTWPTRGHWSCPGAQSSDVPASTEGWRRALLAAQCLWCFSLYCSTAEALQPQSFPAHKACSGCCRTLSSVFSVQQEGRLHGAVHVTAVSALLMGGEHRLVCGTNIQIYFPLAENQCIIHRDSLV